jgi:hypothetical protein
VTNESNPTDPNPTDPRVADGPEPELDEDEALDDLDDDVPVEGEDENEESSEDELEEPKRFFVSSYGWDSDVEGLVKRLNRKDIFTPGFQRKLVWDRTEKSRFIESLILGLPVPTVFLAQDADSKKLNIIDGQQRLRSLQQYLNGEFTLGGRELSEDLRGRYFSSEVAKTKKSKVLADADARSLSDALVHSVVIKPDPSDDDDDKGHEYNKAVVQIFYRLNTSGKALQAQEIRASIFYGELDTLLRQLNQNPTWRSLFGREHGRLKDLEAILRYIALLENGGAYKSPMPRFLDRYMEDNRHIPADRAAIISANFAEAVDLARAVRGNEAFKQGGTFLLTTFDGVMVGITHGLRTGKSGAAWVKERWDELDHDDDYKWSIDEFVNDTNRVEKRLQRAIEIFSK